MRAFAAGSLLAMALLALAAGTGISVVDVAGLAGEDPGGMETVGPLVAGRTVEIGFTSPLPRFGRIALFLGTYARRNGSRISVVIEERDGTAWREAARGGFDAASIEDNSWWRWSLPRPLEGGPSRSYRLLLSSPDATPETAITAWVASGKGEDRAWAAARPLLVVDGNSRAGAVPMSVEFAHGDGLRRRLLGVLPYPLGVAAAVSGLVALLLGTGSLWALALRCASASRAGTPEAP